MTEIGFVIKAGEAVPADVIEVKDDASDTWKRNEPHGWYCHSSWNGMPQNEDGYFREGARLSAAWGPLTVTAVRPQPTEPEPHTPLTLITCGACGQTSMTSHYCGEEDVAKPADESVDLLDLVRQYGDQRERFISCVGCNTLDESRSHEQAGHALLARIEAEVNRLRAEGARLESDNARLKRIHASDEQSVLQVIGERDEAQDWADRLSQAIAEYLRIDIGEHSNMNLPWQAALIALTDAVSPAASTTSGPLVLSLPSVPDGATALIGGKTGKRWVPTNRGHWWQVEGATEGMGLALLLAEEGSVSVVMREPRTWKRTEITEDLPAVVDVDGHGRWKLRTDFDGSPMHYDQPGRGERQFRDLLAMGDVTEVFDEDGTR